MNMIVFRSRGLYWLHNLFGVDWNVKTWKLSTTITKHKSAWRQNNYPVCFRGVKDFYHSIV